MDLTKALACTEPELIKLREATRGDPCILQHTLLNSENLAAQAKFCDTYISPFDRRLVYSLWKHRLIDSDCGANHKGQYDKSGPATPRWRDVLDHSSIRNESNSPRFHPYRIYSLWKIYQTARLPLHPIRFPRDSLQNDGENGGMLSHIDRKMPFFTDKGFMQHISLIPSLAIACEPLSFTKVTGKVRHPLNVNFEDMQFKRKAFSNGLTNALQNIGLQPIEAIRTTLCQAAQRVEPNYRVHKLLRFCDYDTRSRLKGRLFAAVLFNEMAEIIRRATEQAFLVCLPEEDECGYVTWNKYARTRIFGTGRPLDAPLRIRKTFLRDLGLDPGIRARVYVEGQTEYGAMNYLVGGYSHVEVIDLSGRVHQKNQLAFLDNLRMDKRNQVFSFIILDNDRMDNIRAVRKAAMDEHFFGEAYIFAPTFSASAFTSLEARCAILNLAEVNQGQPDELKRIEAELASIEDFEGNMKPLSQKYLCLQNLRKGELWGRLLAETLDEEIWPLSSSAIKCETHALRKAVGRIIISSNYDFLESLNQSVVDPESLQLIPQSAPASS